MTGRPVALSLAALILLTALSACSKPLTVEQRIIATIRNMEASIEANERRRFMEYVAEDFKGQDGRLTREQVQAIVVFQLNRHKRLQAQLLPIHVTDSGDGNASAVFSALVTGGPKWIPDSGQVFEFETHWRLHEDEWLLSAANWTPVVLDDVL